MLVKLIYISTGGVTINNSVFSGGDLVTIVNNSGSNQTITQGSGVTLYNAADGTTGNRTLALELWQLYGLLLLPNVIYQEQG